MLICEECEKSKVVLCLVLSVSEGVCMHVVLIETTQKGGHFCVDFLRVVYASLENGALSIVLLCLTEIHA